MHLTGYKFENTFWRKGLSVAGADEVGRGSFAGPVMAGAIYDRTQSYELVLWILLMLLTFATLLVLFLIRPWINRMTGLNPMPKPQP